MHVEEGNAVVVIPCRYINPRMFTAGGSLSVQPSVPLHEVYIVHTELFLHYFTLILNHL